MKISQPNIGRIIVKQTTWRFATAKLTKLGLGEMELEMLDEIDPDLGGEVAGPAAHQLPVDFRLEGHLGHISWLEGVADHRFRFGRSGGCG